MPRTKNKHIPELIKSAKEQFDNFSEAETQEVFITIREAKSRGLLRKQPPDRCLNRYINAANYLLRIYSTDEFTEALTRSIDNLYVYIALVATNSITTTAWRAPHDSAAETPPLIMGRRGMSLRTSGALKMKLAWLLLLFRKRQPAPNWTK